MLKIHDYIKEHRLSIYRAIQDKHLVYLDNNYWIELQKQSREKDAQNRLLLDKCLHLADSGQCVFPISEMAFWEFLKQGDTTTLKETVELADQLSTGISLLTAHEIIRLELAEFIYNINGQPSFNSIELVWNNLSFLMGYGYLLSLEKGSEQKSFFDFLSKTSLSQMVSHLTQEDDSFKPFHHKDDTDLLDKAKKHHANTNKTFDQMFLSELNGHLELYDHLFDDVLESFHSKKATNPQEDQLISDREKLKQVIFDGFLSQTFITELPSLQIVPRLFAQVRWDKGRKYKINDTLDFLHASFALPYCDYFFTENDLKSMIEKTKLDTLFNCHVESKLKNVLTVLDQLNLPKKTATQ